MRCPHCGSEVSPQAAACPRCGHPFASPSAPFQQGIRREKTSESLAVIGFLVVCGAAVVAGNMVAAWAGIVVLVLGAVAVGAWYFR